MQGIKNAAKPPKNPAIKIAQRESLFSGPAIVFGSSNLGAVFTPLTVGVSTEGIAATVATSVTSTGILNSCSVGGKHLLLLQTMYSNTPFKVNLSLVVLIFWVKVTWVSCQAIFIPKLGSKAITALGLSLTFPSNW